MTFPICSGGFVEAALLHMCHCLYTFYVPYMCKLWDTSLKIMKRVSLISLNIKCFKDFPVQNWVTINGHCITERKNNMWKKIIWGKSGPDRMYHSYLSFPQLMCCFALIEHHGTEISCTSKTNHCAVSYLLHSQSGRVCHVISNIKIRCL